MIEKDGTGIEKSGTGIEKDGTGIEKSGTGIEKSGTGIRKSFLALSLASIAFASQVNANQLEPEGTINLVVQNNTLLISWIIDGSVFSGISTLDGNAFRLPLTEIAQPPLQNIAELLLYKVARPRVSSRKAMRSVIGHFKPTPILNDARRSDCAPVKSGLK